MQKQILQINNYSTTKVGPFNIKQPLPLGSVDYFDPFILIHHSGPEKFNPGQASSRLMPHPHSGFEPVTFLFEGEIYHRDSLGNEGFLEKGDVQWMTSGSGIIHSEGPSENFTKNGGMMELIQLWVNLPAKYKMVKPGYQQVNKNKMPHFFSDNKKIEMQLVSGEYKELKGPIFTYSPIISIMAYFTGPDQAQFTFEESDNTLFYLLDGKVKINGKEVVQNQCVFFKNEGTAIDLETLSAGKFLLLSGQKLKESVVAYGPFVMNTQDQLMQAFKDYNGGKMGTLDS
jgi:hypothetical protein